jgi:hypothetical protein
LSVTLAVAAGLGSALAYGAGTASQHAAAYTGGAGADKLVDLLRKPRWLIGAAGDVLGIGLQLIALDNGPVVLVQPLLVLSLPVAVVLRSLLGAPRPSPVDLLNCAVLILGLGLFFGLLGEPHRGRTIGLAACSWTAGVAFVGGGLAIALMRRRGAVPRAVTFGAVAGCWFGVVSVLVEAVSKVLSEQGASGFARPSGYVPLTTVVALAVVGYLLVQIGFQLGPLGASYPPNLILDPVVAVVLGAVLLGERVPLGPVRVLGYLLCVGVIGWAALRLAEPVKTAPDRSGTIERR